MILTIIWEMIKLAFGFARDIGAAAIVAFSITIFFDCCKHFEENYPGLSLGDHYGVIRLAALGAFIVAVANVPVANLALAYLLCIDGSYEDIKRSVVKSVESDMATEIELWSIKNAEKLK